MNSKYVIIMLSVLVFSCQQRNEGYTVKEQLINEGVYASGQVEPGEFYEVKAVEQDRILHMYVQQGEQVHKGQLLAVLGTPSDEAELASINKAIALAKQNTGSQSAQLKGMAVRINAAKEKYDADATNAERYARLAKTGAVSRKDAEQYRLAAEGSLYEYQNLQQQYKALKNELETSLLGSEQQKSRVLQSLQRKRLLSPVNGFVLNRNFKEGEMLQGGDVLYSIGNNSHYILRLWVDERDISKITPGQDVVFETDASQGQQFHAEVVSVNPVIQNQTRSFEVKAKVTEAGTFYPKSSVEANIVIRAQISGLAVPAGYLVGKDSVNLRKNGKTIKTRILRGVQNDDWIEIKGGLKAGDIIEKEK